jgi:hypothetical protein
MRLRGAHVACSCAGVASVEVAVQIAVEIAAMPARDVSRRWRMIGPIQRSAVRSIQKAESITETSGRAALAPRFDPVGVAGFAIVPQCVWVRDVRLCEMSFAAGHGQSAKSGNPEGRVSVPRVVWIATLPNASESVV